MKRLFKQAIWAFVLSFPGLAHAAIGAGTCGATTINTNTGIEVALPAGFSTGDMLFGINSQISTTGTMRVNESGWGNSGNADFYKQVIATAGVDFVLGVHLKAASGDTGTQTFDDTTAASVARRGAICYFTGVDTTTPFDATPVDGPDTANGNGGTGTYDPAAITTNTANSWVISAIRITDGSPPGVVTPPSGYTMLLDPAGTGSTLGLAYKLVASPGVENPGTWGGFNTTTQDVRGMTFALKEAATVGVWNTGPTFTAASGGIALSGTTTGATAAYLCLLYPSSAEPTEANCAAGTGTLDADSDGSPASVSITSLAPFPSLQACATLYNGTVYTDIECDTLLRSEDADQGIYTLTSVASQSPFALVSDTSVGITEDSNVITDVSEALIEQLQEGMLLTVPAMAFACSPSCIIEDVGVDTVTVESVALSTDATADISRPAYYTPQIAIGDVVEGDDETNLGKAVSWKLDGTFIECEAAACEADETYHTVAYNIQDVSGTVLSTGPPGDWLTDDLFHLYAERPSLSPPDGATLIILNGANQVIGNVCTDPQGLSCVVSTPTSLATDVTIDDDGNLTFGESTPEQEGDGYSIDIYAVNAAGLWASPINQLVYVSDDDITVPDLTGLTVFEAEDTMSPLRPWTSDGSQLALVGSACSDTVPAGEIISHTPSAGMSVTALDPVEIIISLGEAGEGASFGTIIIGPTGSVVNGPINPSGTGSSGC